MNCDEARVLIHAALDTEAAVWEQTKLEAHLAACSECRAYVAVFAPLRKRVSEMVVATDSKAAAAILERSLGLGEGGGRAGSRFPFLSSGTERSTRSRFWHLSLS